MEINSAVDDGLFGGDDLTDDPGVLQAGQDDVDTLRRHGQQQAAAGLRRKAEGLLRLGDLRIEAHARAEIGPVVVCAAGVDPVVAEGLRARQPGKLVEVEAQANPRLLPASQRRGPAGRSR